MGEPQITCFNIGNGLEDFQLSFVDALVDILNGTDVDPMRQSAEDEYFLLVSNRKLHAAMESLTPEQFERTHELIFEGKRISQIAEEDAKSKSAVRNCVYRAINKLRKHYEGNA